MPSHFHKYLCPLVLLLAVSASCSIKEDRRVCPCYLSLDISEAAMKGEHARALVTLVSGSLLSQESLLTQDYLEADYEVTVPRREVSASCVIGHDDLWWRSDTLMPPSGLEWGPVLLARSTEDCDDDLRHVKMSFHKEYCKVSFLLVGVSDPEAYPFDIRLRANSNALRMRDRRPLDGRYTVFARPSNTALFTVLMPRQAENEVAVDLLWHSEEHRYALDDLVTSIDLGRELAAQRYDWEKDDLDDIYVTIDVVRASASISIREWEHTDIEEVI